MALAVSGKCLCGSVTYKAEIEKEEFGACHCNMCRRWTGGVNFSFDAGSNVQFSGDTLVYYESSPWAERGFCSTCGTSLFYRFKEGHGHYVYLGSLDDQELISRMKFVSQIYTDEKPTSYEFVNQTVNMTGAQVLELYSKKE